jgi:UDP-N-acetylglucosamine/UDP-N-acetylgalactosamine 4-epimerase
MSIYLITGGAGFIGSHLVAELVARGERVRVLDNFSTGRWENLTPFGPQVEIIEGDIRSYCLVREAVTGVDFVLHQAALTSIPRSISDPLTTTEVNLLGTLNVLQAIREAGVRRLVYASSSSVYGNNSTLPRRETMYPRPLSPYAISKLAAEQYCRIFWQLYGLETVCLRYFNVFGPGQDSTSPYAAVVPKFISALLHDHELTIYGDGCQSRDFTFVTNIVQANLLACLSPEAVGNVFNIACGKCYTLLDLVGKLAVIMGKEPKVHFTAPRPGSVSHSQANISRARRKLGYEPQIDLVSGLEQTVRWFKS